LFVEQMLAVNLMLEIKRSPLLLAELAQSPDYIPLIRPSILPFLHQPSRVGKWVPVEVRLNNELVGLTLAEVYDDGWQRMAQLYSFIVKPNYRRQGIGSQLFAFTQDLLVKEEKIVSFEFVYIQEDPFTPAIEKILASQGWLPAKTFLIRCHFDAYSFDPPWIHYSFRLPPKMSFFPWKELQPEERKYIEYLGLQRRFLPYLNPFREEELLDKETSVGLRQEGRIVGWSITHRTDPSTLCYLMLYIDSTLLHTGLGIQLLVESIRRHKKLSIPNAVLEINVKEIDPSWWHFIQKRLMPLSQKIERIKRPIRLFI
jgi:GNAT superfamily N-acetyltransferase